MNSYGQYKGFFQEKVERYRHGHVRVIYATIGKVSSKGIHIFNIKSCTSYGAIILVKNYKQC